MLVAAVEAFYEEVDVGRLSSTLPRRTTAGQNRRTHQDPAAVPSVRDMAVQADQLKHTPVKVPPGQPSGTSSVKTTAMQADLPQRSPITSRTDGLQQTKDESRKDHLQAPKEALGVPHSQQSTA